MPVRTAPLPTDEDALATPFVATLVRIIRAQDTYGAWERKSDAELLSPFVVSKEKRREIPVIGNPDAKTVRRLEYYYSAIGLAVEQQTGHVATPLMKLHEEGFGRIVLIAGRLVALTKSLRDVHRFGFDSLAALAAAGAAEVEACVALVRRFPEVANA